MGIIKMEIHFLIIAGIWPQFDRFNWGQFLNNKKDRLGNLSITWIIRVGATGFEPAT